MSLLAILGVRLWDVMCVMFAEPSGRGRNDSPRQTAGMVGNSAKGDDEMTDDKGAGEGPYKVIIDEFRRSCLVYPNGFVCRSLGPDAYTLCSDLNSAYSRGRKAERERCAKIAESHVTKLYGYQVD